MRIGILGAGKVGTAIARVALAAGHDVTVAGSGDAANIRLLVEVLAPGARSAAAGDAVHDADLVVISIPSPKYATLDPLMLAGRVVIDATNYWPETDGEVPELAAGGSSEVLRSHLPDSRLVKSLNHIGYHELETDARPDGAQGRRALAVVSDDEDAAELAGAFVGTLGYDVVIAGPLRLGRRLEPGTEIFTSAMDRMALAAALLTGAEDQRSDHAALVASTP